MFGKILVKWVLLVTNLVVALFLLITLFGSVYSPEKFILPSYFALFFPITLILNIGFVVIWLFARKWNFLISFSLLLFSSNQINVAFPIHFGKIENANTNCPVDLLTYNTKMSGNLVKGTRRKPNKVLQYIANSNADIVCLQEFEVSSEKQYITLEDMMKLFNKYKYKHIEFKAKNYKSLIGIATFSKYPIVNRKRIEFQSRANISIYTDIKIQGKIIRLFNNHLESNRITESDKVMSNSLKEKFDAENITGITKHFSQKLGIAYKLRAHQADTIAQLISESPYNVIVCGDFNDVPTSYTYTKVKGNLKDAFSETSYGFGWTFSEPFYGFRIDFILYDSNAFSPIKFRIDKVNYSDHYPVQCTLNINNI